MARPRNQWTPARKKRLARLYTLTDLKPAQISKIMTENGFSPSQRDVQSKLKALFSDDYSKDFRRFRPSCRANMRMRLRQIRKRKCSQQTTQERSIISQASTNSTTASDFRSSRLDSLVKQPVSSHSQLITAPTRDSVSPFELDNNVLQISLCPISAEPASTIQASMLLNSSIVVESSITISESSSSMYGANALHQRASPSEPQLQVVEGQSSVQYSSRRESTFSTSSRSIASLSRRLGERLSSEYFGHLQSVLRSSSGSSWRSSLSSTRSTEGLLEHSSVPDPNNKLENISSALNAIMTNDSKANFSSNPRQKFASQRRLTKVEQSAWDMLVDEAKLAPIRPTFLPFGLPDMAERSCCYLSFAHYSWFQACSICGNDRAHWLANTMSVCNPQHIPADRINCVDFFGNTPLHYLMYRRWPDKTGAQYSFVLEMMEMGADIKATNTFGQTFLHCSKFSRVLNSSEANHFLRMISELSKAGFSLAHQDRFGQTVLHAVLQNNRPFFRTYAEFDQVAKDITNVFDIFGQYSHGLVANHFRMMPLEPGQSEVARRAWIENYLERPADYLDHLWQDCILRHSPFKASIEDPKARDLVKWINAEGDSVLHVLVKSWSSDWSESELGSLVVELITIGADIEMRDRDGNTPLAVSAVRGSRPSVKALLDAGANFHCRDFDRKGVLLQCSNARAKATEAGDEVLYARILSCSVLLADEGAKQFPSDRDEWVLPGSPAPVCPPVRHLRGSK